jgi:hypothetical protein
VANALDVLTLDEARSALRLGQTDVELLPELERLITSASLLLDSHIGPIVQRTVVEYHDRPPGTTLTLNTGPVASITSVVEDGVTLPASSYLLRRDGDTAHGQIERVMSAVSSPWLAIRPQGIVVTVVAGRMTSTTDSSALAAHCKAGAVLQLQHMWRPYQHGAGVVSEFDTAAVATITQGLGRGVLEHFHGYRRWGYA